RVYRGVIAGRIERAPRRHLGRGDPRGADLASPVAGGRPGALGQPVHHASPRRVRSGLPARYAPSADEGLNGGPKGPPVRTIVGNNSRATACNGTSGGRTTRNRLR